MTLKRLNDETSKKGFTTSTYLIAGLFAFIVLFVSSLDANAWTDFAWNFRFSSGFVTDSANQTYEIGETYPTTRTATFGWTAALADGTRDRDNAVDIRLAGVNKTANTSPKSFRVDLPAAGNYTIYIALGDQGGDHTTGHQYLQIRDNSDALATIDDAGGTVSAHFDDATGVDRTTATWPGSNVGLDVTFATTTAIFVLGDGMTAGDSTIAHIRIVQGGGGGGGPTTTTTTSSTTTTTLPAGPFATIESICPGGTSPRSDIAWCVNFETSGNCTTGQEAGCLSDNGVTSLTVADSDGFKIRPNCPVPAAVGSGCMVGSGKGSGSGPGYANKTISPTLTSASYRMYVKFGAGYMINESTTGNHGPSLNYGDGVACSGYVTPDWTLKNFRIAVEPNSTTCGGHNPDGGNLTANLGDISATPGIWHLYEQRVVLNTVATGTSVSSGNGTVQAWWDGTKILEYTNVNMRGDSTTAKLNDVFLARSYFGLGVPRTKPNLYYDAFVLSNNGTYIGPSGNANTLGSADTLGPYWLGMGGDGAEQMKLASDCSAPGSDNHYVSTGWAYDWRNGKTYVTNPDHNGYACDAGCVASGCTTTNSMQAETTGSAQGAGIEVEMSNINATTANRVVTHGWIYLPTLNSAGGANSYATVFPYVGFSRYCAGGGGNNYNCYAGISVSGGNWAIALKKDGVAGTAHTTSVAATKDTWHEYELQIDNTGKLYLYIDNTWIINGVTGNQDLSWAFDSASTGQQFAPIGIIADSPATRFTLYYDDMDVGGASFVDCTGWNDSPSGYSCPFSSTPPSTGTTSSGIIDFLLKKRRQK